MIPFLTVASAGPDEIWFRALNLAGTNPALDTVLYVVTVLGTSYILALVAVPLWWRGHHELAIDVLAVLLVTILVTDALKLVTDRARPCEVLADVRTLPFYACSAEPDPAFPSGHASRVFALATILGLRLGARVGVPAGAFGVLVGLSRIYLGVHWPSDVLAGAVLGIVLAVAVRAVDRRAAGYARLRGSIVAFVDRVLTRFRRA